ncbi:4Fe-4S binding protein [Granulosicoccaceae sp. 1_MG-2023]|nr:4Fe-4S binding protein [Granulosicoccaceae sp. 1_MG-2023]
MSVKSLLSGLALCLLCLWLPPAGAQQADELPIEKLFPKLTRIGEKQSDLPVYPVYQLNELLGYAWVSTDINNIAGFAGKPIKLLIGLDTQGRFSGVEVLDHHEPVFLHGLGNQALLDFMQQYEGRSVADQIIVSTANNRRSGSGDASEGGPVYIDGVTKATVSVLIINDVMLSTALNVARRYLEGFEAPPQSALTETAFEPLTLQEMLARGLLLDWRISMGDAAEAFGRDVTDYPDFSELDAAPDALFSELYYAYLNAPLIGRNLLGDEAWETLMADLPEGDHLLWVGSRGPFSHVARDFTPASAPNRLSLTQNGAVIEIKDYNVADSLSTPALAELPAIDRAHVFRIKSISGFDLGGELSLGLNVNLAMNHLVREQHTLTQAYQLPQTLWVRLESDPGSSGQQTPLWKRIWHDRATDVAVLCAALGLLLWVFIRQQHYSRNARAFHAFRWAWLWFLLLYIGFYLQGQLSVVNIFTLLHAFVDGFDITVFLLDPVIFILWCVTFASLFLWGRGLFCGWLCPFGALQEMSSWLGKKLHLRQWRISEKTHRRLIYLKYPILLTLVISSFYSLTLAERLAEVEPFKTSITLVFVRHWPFVLYALALLGIGMFVHKFYCRYLCPLGAGLAVIGWFRSFHWLKRIPMCGKPCQTCHNRCEIGAIPRDGKIDYNECVQCLECIVILNDETQCASKLLEKKRKVIPVKAVPVAGT